MTKEQDLMSQELELEMEYKQLGALAFQRAMQQAKESDIVATSTIIGQNFFNHKAYELQQKLKEWLEYELTPRPGAKPIYVSIIKQLAYIYRTDTNKVKYDEISTMLASITLTVVINSLGHEQEKHYPINNLGCNITEYVYNEYCTKVFESWLELEDNFEYRNALKGIDKRVGYYYRKTYLNRTMSNCKFQEPAMWDATASYGFGNTLLRYAQDVTGYFDIHYSYKDKTPGYMVATDEFCRKWRANEDNIQNHAHKLCPMVVPPRPWVSYDEGGYWGELSSFHHLLRLKGLSSIYGRDYMAKLKELDLSSVYDAVNAIQSTPWVINKQVLEVLQTLRKLDFVIPSGKEGDKDKPHIINTDYERDKPEKCSKDATENEIKLYKERAIAYYRKEPRLKSLVNRAVSIINTAQRFSKYEAIWFPHNLDFRGRIYPIPLFSPQGDDLSKGLLLFKDAPPCASDDCLDYLAIMGANLAGEDKQSYDDRIKWVNENEQVILRVAADPIAEKWWLSKDKKPVQLLAWCFEWARAKEYIKENGSIIGFVTGIPYAQDGTCSGLQHFSAIFRDEIGGTWTNLVPQDKPNDIYAKVADAVNVLLKQDAVNGSSDGWDEKTGKFKLGDKTKAQLWLNFGVDRKVCKRPTMTIAYGASVFGYKEQIFEDTIKPYLDKHGENDVGLIFTKQNAYQCALYLASLIWESVKHIVVKAVEGMRWLHECAKLVTNDSNVVSWHTPMGLLLQQNYLSFKTTRVWLRCQGKRFQIYVPRQEGKISQAKSVQSIAPNFIHSMDACHLQMTVLKAHERGINHFTMVHDSYGCPIAQAKTMYDTVREAFVEMYTDNDVLEEFRAALQPLTDKELPPPPERGKLNLEDVKNSKYIFC